MTSRLDVTWDGVPVVREPPYASCIVVWRDGPEGSEFLVLHRLAPGGVGFEGDWAWTPPSGARQPGETPDEAAVRELLEETGITVMPTRVSVAPSDEVALYSAEVSRDVEITLDAEHDRYVWLPLAEATRRCRPVEVATCIELAAAGLAP